LGGLPALREGQLHAGDQRHRLPQVRHEPGDAGDRQRQRGLVPLPGRHLPLRGLLRGLPRGPRLPGGATAAAAAVGDLGPRDRRDRAVRWHLPHQAPDLPNP
ncbi:unnamed protein product, partial [Effrenium voratum]